MTDPARTLAAAPLTAEAFAAFGDVIEATGASFPINAGMCDRFHDLARIEFTGEGARAGISIGYGRPYPLPLVFDLVERHPLGSQAFVPMTEDPFLVVVAPDEAGRPGRPRAFLTAPGPGGELPARHLARGPDPARPAGAVPDRRPGRRRHQPRGIPLRGPLDGYRGLRTAAPRPPPTTTHRSENSVPSAGGSGACCSLAAEFVTAVTRGETTPPRSPRPPARPGPRRT